MSHVEAPAREHILVLGAGELGLSVLRALSRSPHRPHGTEITVLLRGATIRSTDAEKRRELAELRELGISVEEGDVAGQSVAELAAIFARYDAVISCVGFAAGPGTQRKLAHAALDSGVKRYFPWQFGVDYDAIGRGGPQDLFDEQLDVRELLRGQDRTEWVIVSTGMFTSFLFEPEFGVVDLGARRVNALGSWDTAVTLTTPEDIGALTAEIVYAVPRFADEVVFVAGDTITYGELADLVEDTVGSGVDRRVWTLDHLFAELAADPGDTMKKYRAAFGRGVGVAWDRDRTFNARRGIATTTAADWAADNLISN